MTPRNLAKKLSRLAIAKKASDVAILDLRPLTDMTDFFVICSADSDTQVKAIADHIAEEAARAGASAWHREGVTQRQWILLDFVDVVVHVFRKEMRKYYGLEKLWGDAKREEIKDEAPAPAAAAAKPARKRRTAAT